MEWQKQLEFYANFTTRSDLKIKRKSRVGVIFDSGDENRAHRRAYSWKYSQPTQ